MLRGFAATVGIAGAFITLQPGDLVRAPQVREACWLAPAPVTRVMTMTCLDPKRRFGRQQVIATYFTSCRIRVVQFSRRGKPRTLFTVSRC